ncbi:hypothetical protein [Sporosarcina sp. FSL W7-1283]|uniref:hypothetical protein n=1 Tax=Sporosarcina sp. FSL W7-1283 TaxID=2921560 RepID=UPI0030FC4DC7
MPIRELEILVAALEGDVIRQKESDKRDEPAFKAWLEDTEKLLKKVRLRLSNEKSREALIDFYKER